MEQPPSLPPGVDPVVAELVARHGLRWHPEEGTLLARTYTAARRLDDGVPLASAMIGLYADHPRSLSRFHRLTSDELWHCYAGDPFRLVLLHPDGSSEEIWLAPGGRGGAGVQALVPAGTWQAAELGPGGAWALYGCTLAPAYTDDGFEAGHVDALLARYPDRVEDIRRLGFPDPESRQGL